jgi:hypothetical protein
VSFQQYFYHWQNFAKSEIKNLKFEKEVILAVFIRQIHIVGFILVSQK